MLQFAELNRLLILKAKQMKSVMGFPEHKPKRDYSLLMNTSLKKKSAYLWRPKAQLTAEKAGWESHLFLSTVKSHSTNVYEGARWLGWYKDVMVVSKA